LEFCTKQMSFSTTNMDITGNSDKQCSLMDPNERNENVELKTSSEPMDVDVKESEPPVYIVGCGPAGIAASYYLTKNNIKCFILEAKHCVGGRAQSLKLEYDLSVDIGPEWIHYTRKKKHEMTVFAKEELNIDISKQILKKLNIKGKMCIYDEQSNTELPGRVYGPIDRRLNDVIYRMPYVNYKKLSKNKGKNFDISVFEGIKNEYGQLLNLNCNDFGINNGLLKRIIDNSVTFYEGYDGVLDHLSLKCWDDDTAIEGGNLFMQGHYGEYMKQIFNKMDIDMYSIQYNTPVSEIKYSQTNKYKIEIRTDNNKIYHCNHVILCVPVYCLQQNSIKFTPQLKPNISKAINDGFKQTISNKVILYFETEFSNNINTIKIICDPDNYSMKAFKTYTSKVNLNDLPGYEQNYGYCSRISSKYNVWRIFLSSKFGIIYKDMDTNTRDNIILNHLMNIFKNVFKLNDIKLKKYHITHWYNDKYTRGTWTIFPKGSRGKIDCNLLANQSNDNIFDIKSPNATFNHNLTFAGEYTDAHELGTVGCAFRTGKRAAKQVIKSRLKSM